MGECQESGASFLCGARILFGEEERGGGGSQGERVIGWQAVSQSVRKTDRKTEREGECSGLCLRGTAQQRVRGPTRTSESILIWLLPSHCQ